MNTPSDIENSGVETQNRNPMIAGISKAVLIAAMALIALAGCDPNAADVREATTTCLDKKENAGVQVRELCKDNNATLKEIVFRDCEVPKAETKIHFLRNQTTVGAENGPVNSGIQDFCDAKEEDRKD